MSDLNEEQDIFSLAASSVVGTGNDLLNEDDEANVMAIASGMLAGAIQFWLFSRQPCDDENCEDCRDVSTAELRIEKLLEEVKEFAKESEYYHSPNDSDAGSA